MLFEPIRDNPDLCLDADPAPEGWDRIAIVSMWHDASRARRNWPRASVIGPLRSPRGLDELVRNLLANPQIRVVVLDGPDYTPSGGLFNAVFDLWAGKTPERLGEDIREAASIVFEHVQLIQWDSRERDIEEVWFKAQATTTRDEDRPGGKQVHPMPEPKATTNAPHGDPGDRIAGATVADVHVRALRHIMGSGRLVETQYGGCRELLNLVTVIRDPRVVYDAVWNGTDENAKRDSDIYYKRLVTKLRAPEAAYSYGSRLRGSHDQTPHDGHQGVTNMWVDQVAMVGLLMERSIDTRAAFLTAWRPETDSGYEKNRPCLVGIWFRAVAGELHVTAAFRSHDMFAGYPENLTSICMWLVDLAAWHKLKPGTVTCTSYSAHVYERDWVDAQKLVEAHRRNGLRWDPRSTWMVETVEKIDYVDPVPGAQVTPVGAVGVFRFERFEDDQAVVTLLAESGRVREGYYPPTEEARRERKVPRDTVRLSVLSRMYRATALTPDGADVIAVFEAASGAGLRVLIEDSGLIQEVGNALWLGGEIERVTGGGA